MEIYRRAHYIQMQYYVAVFENCVFQGCNMMLESKPFWHNIIIQGYRDVQDLIKYLSQINLLGILTS